MGEGAVGSLIKAPRHIIFWQQFTTYAKFLIHAMAAVTNLLKKNVHLIIINVYAKFDEFTSLTF